MPMIFVSIFSTRPRTGNDRPSQQQQQRSDESSAGGSWRIKTRPTGGDQGDESRDSGRSGAPSSGNPGRSDDNSSWRTRERTRLERFVIIVDYFEMLNN